VANEGRGRSRACCLWVAMVSMAVDDEAKTRFVNRRGHLWELLIIRAMPRHAGRSSDDEEPLEDNTEALFLRSKRTERQQKRRARRDRKREAVVSLVKLPTELILACLQLLPPSDVLAFRDLNRRFRQLVDANARSLGHAIIRQRYSLLAQCFPLPKLLADVDPAVRPLLVNEKRQRLMGMHHKPYQHIQPPDAHLLCTCLSCIMTWNNLCLTLDFAQWQNHLDHGTPLPMIPRGQTPAWNQNLVHRNACVVRAALTNPLWYAWTLEMHLQSTIRAIRRHAKNKGNQRKHVDMTEGEAALGTDTFLTKPGPLSLEFPFHRDEYYMLEAYLPNRYWKRDHQRWIYGTSVHHERDLELVARLAVR